MRARPEMPRPTRDTCALIERVQSASDVEELLRANAKHGFPLFHSAPDLPPDVVVATFCWTGGEGVEWVFLDANGLTDRDWLEDGMLTRTPGTDLWHVSLQIPSNFRGSYCFLVGRSELVKPDGLTQAAKREWWLSLLDTATSDPLNSGAKRPSSFGFDLSEVAAPDAPPQRLWTSIAQGSDVANKHIRHRLDIANVNRDVWLWRSSDKPQPGQSQNLAILFDGRTWAERHVIFDALTSMMCSRTESHLTVVLIDSVDQAVRSTDLTCSPSFRQDLCEVVIPWVSEQLGVMWGPKQTVLAGQSFGGLAAADFVLEHPDVASNAICISGSFWWAPEPAQSSNGPDWIWDKRLSAGDRSSLWFWLTAGLHEGDMSALSTRFAIAARVAGADVERSDFCGGHDAVQWREKVLEGLERFVDRNEESGAGPPLL